MSVQIARLELTRAFPSVLQYGAWYFNRLVASADGEIDSRRAIREKSVPLYQLARTRAAGTGAGKSSLKERAGAPDGAGNSDKASVLGKGLFGTVYLGESQEHGRVAIKVLRRLRFLDGAPCVSRKGVLPHAAYQWLDRSVSKTTGASDPRVFERGVCT